MLTFKTFNPRKPAAEMTAAELMACYVAAGIESGAGTRGSTGYTIVRRVADIYDELNRQMGEKIPEPVTNAEGMFDF